MIPVEYGVGLPKLAPDFGTIPVFIDHGKDMGTAILIGSYALEKKREALTGNLINSGRVNVVSGDHFPESAGTGDARFRRVLGMVWAQVVQESSIIS